MQFFQFIKIQWFVLFSILLWSGAPRALAVPDEDGLYAVIKTELGEFTVRLAFEKAPRTVANFAGLAEGKKTWFDIPNHSIRNKKFYDGITFHRIVSDFVIQGGSPNGLGNDGPGYRFKDEFHPDLRHDKAGILSMANSGANTNGSQFFITLSPQSHLDDKHSVFGEVVEGMEQVFSLGDTPVNAPGTKPVIESIEIIRVGEAAMAFGVDSLEDPLPDVTSADVSMVRVPSGSIELQWVPNPATIEYLYATANLVNWSVEIVPSTGRILMDNIIAANQMAFIKIIQIETD